MKLISGQSGFICYFALDSGATRVALSAGVCDRTIVIQGLFCCRLGRLERVIAQDILLSCVPIEKTIGSDSARRHD